MINLEYPCTCDHTKRFHARVRYAEQQKHYENPTDECYADIVSGFLCPCLHFKADNLKYLERLNK